MRLHRQCFARQTRQTAVLALLLLAVPALAASPDPPATAAAPFDPSTLPDPAALATQATGLTLKMKPDDAQRMTLPVEIGGAGPYHFIIDTGSQRSIVATELALKLALPERPPVRIISMAGPATIATVEITALRFGAHEVRNIDALRVDHTDLGGMGLIGLDGLKGKRLTLDFKTHRMEIGDSEPAHRHRDDPDTIVVRAHSRLGQLILTHGRVDGKSVSVILDTGAEVSVGNMALFHKFAAKRMVVPPEPTILHSVTGGQVPALFAVVREIRIASLTMRNVPMVFVDAAPFAELGLKKHPSMLLGMQMLRMFRQVAIDFGDRHVDFQLWRNGHAPPDDTLALGRQRPLARD